MQTRPFLNLDGELNIYLFECGAPWKKFWFLHVKMYFLFKSEFSLMGDLK